MALCRASLDRNQLDILRFGRRIPKSIHLHRVIRFETIQNGIADTYTTILTHLNWMTLESLAYFRRSNSLKLAHKKQHSSDEVIGKQMKHFLRILRVDFGQGCIAYGLYYTDIMWLLQTSGSNSSRANLIEMIKWHTDGGITKNIVSFWEAAKLLQRDGLATSRSHMSYLRKHLSGRIRDVIYDIELQHRVIQHRLQEIALDVKCEMEKDAKRQLHKLLTRLKDRDADIKKLVEEVQYLQTYSEQTYASSYPIQEYIHQTRQPAYESIDLLHLCSHTHNSIVHQAVIGLQQTLTDHIECIESTKGQHIVEEILATAFNFEKTSIQGIKLNQLHFRTIMYQLLKTIMKENNLSCKGHCLVHYSTHAPLPLIAVILLRVKAMDMFDIKYIFGVLQQLERLTQAMRLTQHQLEGAYKMTISSQPFSLKTGNAVCSK